MGKQGKKITKEEGEKIMECLARKMTPREMSPMVRRSANAIYVWLRTQGVSLPMHNKHHPDKPVDRSEQNYSVLPDSALFNWQKFPSF